MQGFIDHGLFELAFVAAAFLIGRRFLLRRATAVLAAAASVAVPLVLFFLAENEVQTWLLAGVLAASMLNIALIVELAGGRRFLEQKREKVARAEQPAE